MGERIEPDQPRLEQGLDRIGEHGGVFAALLGPADRLRDTLLAVVGDDAQDGVFPAVLASPSGN